MWGLLVPASFDDCLLPIGWLWHFLLENSIQEARVDPSCPPVRELTVLSVSTTPIPGSEVSVRPGCKGPGPSSALPGRNTTLLEEPGAHASGDLALRGEAGSGPSSLWLLLPGRELDS